MIWQAFIMIIGLGGLVWFNTKGIKILTYGRKMKNFDSTLKNGPTLAQSVEQRSKMMNQKKSIYAMSADEKQFRDFVKSGNRSCLTWNGNLLDGAFPPLNRNMHD